MPSSRLRTTLVVTPLALALLGAASGCGVSSEQPRSQGTVTVTATPTPSPSESVGESASPSPSPTPSPSSTVTAPPEAALLTADEMPALNDTVRWKLRRTGAVTSRPFGLCARVDMLSVGAEQAVERVFAAGTSGTASTDSAAQEVVALPDATTTGRVTKVLRSWHRTCARQVKQQVAGSGIRVRRIQAVPVSQGTGWWYLVSYTSRGEGHFHAFGAAVVGNRMSLIRMDHLGQDHNYPAGQDPVELAVKAAATKLG